MRLLRTDNDDLRLKQIEGKIEEPYAILSHTWTDDEVLFADVDKTNVDRTEVKLKKGYRKLFFALGQARRDGYDYLWADTCCIDKSSSAELSEAINSMFRYYERAAVCYVYLSDVENQHDLHKSRWFTRGWTLQELLAPDVVLFFSSHWELIGDKRTLQPAITKITGISDRILLKEDPVVYESVAKRMSWVSSRETTRVEDMAYCLLGIFGINMPLLYGEEEDAFIRLQEEITKVTDDQTLFAWLDPEAPDDKTYGLLAKSPRFFSKSAHYVPCADFECEEPYSMVNKRLKIEVRFLDRANKRDGHQLPLRTALLSCMDARQTTSQLSISLKSCSIARNEYRRIHCSTLGMDRYQHTLTSIYVPQVQPIYHVRKSARPDFIVYVKETLTKGQKARLSGCTYRTRPDPTRHVIGDYTQYPKCSGSQTPRFFVVEAYPGCMAVAMHYEYPQVPFGSVTVMFGMTRDLKFGCSAISGGADMSLEALQDAFSPQIADELVFPYSTGGMLKITISRYVIALKREPYGSCECAGLNLIFTFEPKKRSLA